MNAVLDKLAQARFVNVNAARLPMMYLASYNSRIRSGFHFKSGDSVVVDVVALKVAQAVVEGEDTDISAVVDVIPTHNRIGMVLDPDTRQCIPANLIVLIQSLSMVCDVQANILTIGYVTPANHRFGSRSAYANGSSNFWGGKINFSF
jgi:hypothetical protein